MVDIPKFNYANWTLEQKHAWLTGGKGAQSAANDPACRLHQLAERMAQSSDNVRRSLGGTEVEWRGHAATAVAGSLHKAADWAGGAGQGTGQGGGQVDDYGQSFTALAARIPAPTLTGSFWDYAQAVFALPDYLDKLREEKTADQNANVALAAHETKTRDSVTRFPDVAPAPTLTRDGGTTPPSGATGRIGGGGAGGGPGGPAVGTGGGASGAGSAGSGGPGSGGGGPSLDPADGSPGSPAGAGAAAPVPPHAAGGPSPTNPSSWAPPAPGGAVGSGVGGTGTGGDGESTWTPITPSAGGRSGIGLVPGVGGSELAPRFGWSPPARPSVPSVRSGGIGGAGLAPRGGPSGVGGGRSAAGLGPNGVSGMEPAGGRAGGAG